MRVRLIPIFVLGLTLVAVTGVFASGGTEKSSAASTGPQTMYVWNVDTNYAQWFAEQFKPFEAQNNVTIQLTTVPSEDFHAKFVAAVQAKTDIDALLQNGQDVRWMATDGMLTDLSSIVTYKDRFVASALVPYTIGGKLYALPYGSMNSSALYYSKTIFQKYNLTPPKTYSDLVNVVNELKKHGIYGISMGGATIYMWPMWFFQTFAQTSGNNSEEMTRKTLQGEVKFTSAPYVKAMQALADFGKDGIFEPGVNGVDDRGGAQAIFTSGKAAMFYGGTWELGGFIDAGMTADTLGILKFPKIVSNDLPVQMTGGSGNAATIFARIDPAKMTLAEKFIDFVTSDSFDQAYCENAHDPLVVNKGVTTSNTSALDKQLKEQFLPDTVTFLDWTWPQKIVTAFQEQIQAVVGQQTTATKAMETIQATFDSLVSSGYKFQ